MANESTYPKQVIKGMYGPPYNDNRPEITGGLNPFGAHDALAAGMPTWWNWSRGACRMQWNNFPLTDGANRVTPSLTGRFGDAAPDTHGHNYRCHIRNLELWYYARNSNTWKILEDSDSDAGYYTKERFVASGSVPSRLESDGSRSFTPKVGFWVHFYGKWPTELVPEPFKYIHARAELKLSGPDAATARVLGNVGIDVNTVQPDGRKTSGSVFPAVLQSRMLFVTPTYQWFTGTSMYPNEILATPPPAPSGYSGSDDEVDPPIVTPIVIPRRSMIIVP